MILCLSNNNLINKFINGRRSQTNRDKKSNLLFLPWHDQFKSFNSNFLRTDKKHYKRINIYYIGYIKIEKNDDYESIYSVNPLYMFVNHARRCIEEKNGSKYLIFDNSVNENK